MCVFNLGQMRRDLTPLAIWEGTWILLTGSEWKFLKESLELNYAAGYQCPPQDICWRCSTLSTTEQSSERSDVGLEVTFLLQNVEKAGYHPSFSMHRAVIQHLTYCLISLAFQKWADQAQGWWKQSFPCTAGPECVAGCTDIFSVNIA